MVSSDRFHRVGLAVVVGILAIVPAAPQELRFPADVERVTVDAVVLDRDGEPVAGLRPEDFELRDEGELREILSFQALDVAAGRVPSSHGGEGVSTNDDARPQRAVAVFWDDVHLSPPFALRAKEALRPWLSERLAEGERVVLTSAGGAWHVADDSRGAEALLGVLDGLKGARPLEEGPEYVSDFEAVAISELDDVLTYGVVYRRFAAQGVLGCVESSGGIDRRFMLSNPCPVLARALETRMSARVRLQETLRALAHLADVLAVGRGRKSIVLVSEGFLQDPGSAPGFARVRRAAQRANAVLSFLDPGGLRAPAAFSVLKRSSPRPDEWALSDSSGLADRAGSEGLARDTGGLVLRTNDLAEGLERILRESHTHYLLGFAPPPDAATKGFRRLSLKVRRPGLRVRAREGYTVRDETPGQPEEELRRVLDAPFDVPGEPMRVAAWVLEPRSPRLSRVVLGIGVAPPPGTGGSGAEPRKVELVVEVQGEQRRWRLDRQLVFGPRAAESEESTWEFPVLGLELPAGAFRARAVVRDESGRVRGAVSHVFDVPRADAWHVSTPILASSLRVGPDGRTPVPSVLQEFAADGMLQGQFSVYATPGEPDSAAARLSGSWSLRRTDAGELERSGRVSLTPAPEGAVSCLFRLPLAGLAAGDYELALRVRDDVAARELREVRTIAVATAPGGSDSPAPRAPGIAGDAGATAAYATAVERYARGGSGEDLSDLIEASPRELERLSRAARPKLDPRLRAAEIALHTEIALARLPDEGSDSFDSRVEVIEGLDREPPVEVRVGRAPGPGAPRLDTRLRTGWRLALAAAYLRFYDGRNAQRLVEQALDLANDDPLLLAVLGASFERQALQAAADPMADGTLRARSYRGKARDAYERALRTHPHAADARLRLARSLDRQGEYELALEHAKRVLDDTDAADLRYVALLLAGRALEQRGAYAEAAERYLAACDADPRGSVALLGASHALKAAGEPEKARPRLLAALRTRDSGDYVDPWQDYDQGRPAWLIEAVASLRRSLAAR